MTNGNTQKSNNKTNSWIHALSTAEASSGEFILSTFNASDIAEYQVAIRSTAGAPRAITQILPGSGTVDIKATSLSAGDIAFVQGIWYVDSNI